MAKYRHRVFEMYDFRDEAVVGLRPKPATAAAGTPEILTYKHFSASRVAGIVHVQFSDAQALSDAAASELREDLAQLAEDMDRDSRILLDFTGIEPFDPAAIEALVVFDKKLRVRGSRMVLCCLAPEAREAVFAACAS